MRKRFIKIVSHADKKWNKFEKVLLWMKAMLLIPKNTLFYFWKYLHYVCSFKHNFRNFWGNFESIFPNYKVASNIKISLFLTFPSLVLKISWCNSIFAFILYSISLHAKMLNATNELSLCIQNYFNIRLMDQ